MKNWTPQELQDLYVLARNVQWRYRLDRYEDEVLTGILKTLRKAQGEAQATLGRWMLSQFQVERTEALLSEFDSLTLAMRLQLTGDIRDAAAVAGEWATAEHVSITSFGGLVAGFNNVALTADQFRSFFDTEPLGGKLLAEWVDAAFDSTAKAGMLEELQSGVLQGEGYSKLVRRLGSDFELTQREAITLARTYVQSANVTAQEAVYAANADIVDRVKWTSTLENGFSKSGRGTCMVCASLDGKEFARDSHPPCPRHPRCRCLLVPVTKSWKDLGLDLPELENAARPYTKRPDQNIDAGGKRTIEEVGFHDGDYGSWLEKQPESVQNNAVGPKRAAMLRAGQVTMHDLTDDAGNLRTIEQLRALK